MLQANPILLRGASSCTMYEDTLNDNEYSTLQELDELMTLYAYDRPFVLGCMHVAYS